MSLFCVMQYSAPRSPPAFHRRCFCQPLILSAEGWLLYASKIKLRNFPSYGIGLTVAEPIILSTEGEEFISHRLSSFFH